MKRASEPSGRQCAERARNGRRSMFADVADTRREPRRNRFDMRKRRPSVVDADCRLVQANGSTPSNSFESADGRDVDGGVVPVLPTKRQTGEDDSETLRVPNRKNATQAQSDGNDTTVTRSC